jgi:hypothetical protein
MSRFHIKIPVTLLLLLNRAMSLATTSNTGATRIGDLVAPDPPNDLRPVYADDGFTLIKTPTRMNYVSKDTVKAIVKRDFEGNDSNVLGVSWQEETVWVENGRRDPRISLHLNGFELVNIEKYPIKTKNHDFLNKNQVLDDYYPLCEKLLQNYLGKNVQVTAFDHNVRKQRQGEGETTQKPLGLVHGDYTATSAPRRLQLLAELPKINDVWR